MLFIMTTCKEQTNHVTFVSSFQDMVLCVNHQIQQIVQLYLNRCLFVDTTGVNIENYDLPQTEKLHHNNVLSKPGYV